MPLGAEVDLDPGHIVLRGYPTLSPKRSHLTPKKRHSAPIFSPCLLAQTAGWIQMPLGTEVGLDPADIVLDGNPAPPPKGAQQPPTFRPMSIVAKQLPISLTAELLSLLCLYLHTAA